MISKSFALVGVGFMGKGIAMNVIAKASAGTKIYLYDQNLSALHQHVDSLAKEFDCSNVFISSSSVDALEHADIVALSLPSEKIQAEVLFHANHGLVSKYHEKHLSTHENSLKSLQNKIIVDHSTSSKEFVMKCHAEAKKLGVDYLDAPVSGGPQGACAGSLSIMLGGEKGQVDQLHPLLSLYAQKIMHMGEIGSGMAAKLINQALVGLHAQGAVEAVYLAQNHNISLVKLKDLLQNSWGQSKILDLVFEDVLKAEKEGDIGEVLRGVKSPAPLRNLNKDFLCVMGLSDGARLPAIELAKERIATACGEERRLGDAPFASLLTLLPPSTENTA